MSWMNHIKAGSAAMVTWTSAMAMLVTWLPGIAAEDRGDASQALTIAMLAGLAPSFLAGMLLSRVQLNHVTRSAILAFK